MSFTGGKLKFKGDNALGAKGSSKKKSKSKKLSSGDLVVGSSLGEQKVTKLKKPNFNVLKWYFRE